MNNKRYTMADRCVQASIEQKVKLQFARIFRKTKYPLFKKTVDYYFRRAASPRRADVDVDNRLCGDESVTDDFGARAHA